MSRANRWIREDADRRKNRRAEKKAKTDHIRHQASGISHQPSKEGEQTTFVTLQLPAISHQPQPSSTIGSFLGFLDLSDSKNQPQASLQNGKIQFRQSCAGGPPRRRAGGTDNRLRRPAVGQPHR